LVIVAIHRRQERNTRSAKRTFAASRASAFALEPLIGPGTNSSLVSTPCVTNSTASGELTITSMRQHPFANTAMRVPKRGSYPRLAISVTRQAAALGVTDYASA
jgi:hypothetical protein